MIDVVVLIICFLASLLIVDIRKAYFAQPIKETKRRARKGEVFSSTIYPVVAYGATLRLFLWLILGVFSAVGVALVSKLLPLWMASILTLIWLAVIFSWLPNSRVSELDKKLATKLAVFLTWLFGWAYLKLKVLDRLLAIYAPRHNGIFENEDLHELFNAQGEQQDNRIKSEQLIRLRRFLEFESTSVSSCLKPWDKTLKLFADNPVGPKLLDEMHRSKQSTFIVLASKSNPNPVGILNKEDIGLKSDGLISQYMHGKVDKINEDAVIEQALAKFSLSGQTILVVVSNSEEIIGTIVLKDALASMLAVDVKPHKEEQINSDLIVEEADISTEQGGY